MADTILTHSMIASKALQYLKNELSFARNVFKGYNEEFVSVGGYKKGNAVTIHLPNKGRTIDGPDITGSIPDQREKSTTVTLDNHKTYPLDFSAQQLTLDIERFGEKYIEPGVIALANIVDLLGLQEFKNVYNLVGTAGTTPSTYGALTAGATRMDQEAVPRNKRNAVFSPVSSWAMADGELKSVFDQQNVRKLTEKGFQGTYAGFDILMDQNVVTHTTGTGMDKLDGATVQVRSAPAEGATTLELKGFATGETLAAGDVFTVATVAGVNPVSGQAWENNTLRQFVVLALATADGSGFMSVTVGPEIISSAAGTKLLPDQTVNDLPATNDFITGFTTDASTGFTQNMLFTPEAFALTMVPFEAPDSAGASVKWATAHDPQLGLSITFASAFDIKTYVETYRLDILFGWDTVRPELAVRLTG